MLLSMSEVLRLITIKTGQIAAKIEKTTARSDGKNNEKGVALGMIKPDTKKY